MSYSQDGRNISKVAVIGSGQIGPDIALHFTKVLAPYGVQTVVVDVAQKALEAGKAKLEKKIAKGVQAGAFTAAQQAEMLAHVAFTSDYASIQGADLVVEAATEDQELKGRIFAQAEKLAAAGAILASNSSHLEPDAIFARAADKSRTTVIHYFFPAERNVVVEVVPGAATSPQVTEWLLAFYEAIGKVPVRVKARYGYAVDPIFEGLFQASALLVETGVATSRQVDAAAAKALGLTVGSFTAMNLTGGNPITAVGLRHYHDAIHAWFRVPGILEEKVKSGAAWDVPARGETVDVPPDLGRLIADELRGAYFGLACEIVDAGLITVSDLDMALELALDIKPAFRFMNEIGTAEALRLVRAYAKGHPGFPVPACLAERGAKNEPFAIPVIQRRDRDGVAILTIRRPKVLNALNQQVFDELRGCAADLRSDRSVRAVVLTGFGQKAFVSGADVNFLARIETAEQGEKTSADSQAAIQAIADLGKPVVCALNGLAFGGGNELAMACTMRVAVKGLKVLAGQPEVHLGIIPGAGGTQRLPRIVGVAKAAEIMRTGRPIGSAEARAIGLISEEVAEGLLRRAVELARGLADGSVRAPAFHAGPIPDVPRALPEVDIQHLSRKVDGILCRAILEGARAKLEEGLALEARCFGEVCATRDMRIGVENFLKNGPKAKAQFVHA
ncbi:MAG: 3-hydroxyacyl-CoA dehydrogenase/enoyl-CoA hydratase family protein [Planctomycetes bacterium]|nr:3-hydroxyacyl-CoA dehydrogenase/enoyl-CoA hydratase family protein [Planctomycetota bacterium]